MSIENKPMDQDLGFVIEPMVKLTQAKRFFKSDENYYTLWNIYDNKKLILSKNDMTLLAKINIDDSNTSEWTLDLERYFVKFVHDKQFYQIIDKKTYFGIMGLKLDTLCNMMKFAENF